MEYTKLDFLELCDEIELDQERVRLVVAAWGEGDGTRFPWAGGFVLHVENGEFLKIERATSGGFTSELFESKEEALDSVEEEYIDDPDDLGDLTEDYGAFLYEVRDYLIL